MIFVFISVVVPLIIFFSLPPMLEAVFRGPKTSRWPLVIGGLCFFASWYLPSPLIQGQETQFMTHLVGGGIFTGFVWLYVKKHLRLELSAWLEILSLFALVSMLGVANELFELGLVQLGFARLSSIDAWWDLLANTLGALTFWLVYRAWRLVMRNQR